MATFTIDLFTGDVYLFSGDFGGTGGTSPVTGATYPEVNNFSELPTPASAYNGKTYLVRNSSGAYILNRREAGLYISLGGAWRRLGDIPSFFRSDNFQVYDGADNTKGVTFDTSNITTNTFRQLTIQDSSGTIAYLADLDTKVDTSIFNFFTGTTAPITYLTIGDFEVYSGQTLSLIQSKQDVLIAGKGISILNNEISVNLPTTLQLVDNTGGLNVNTIQATPVIWTDEIFSGNSLSFTGGSRIYILEDAVYGLSYVMNVFNDSPNKNIGTLIRKNGNEDITPLSSASVNMNDTSTNIMPEYHAQLVVGDYLELIGFRIGGSGIVDTVPEGSWIRIRKII